MNNRYLKIEDNPDYVMDSENNAILNTNLDLVTEYKAKRKQTKLVKTLEQEINMLKKEIAAIKTHLNLS